MRRKGGMMRIAIKAPTRCPTAFSGKECYGEAITITIRRHVRNLSGEAGIGTAATGMAAAASFARVCARR